MNERIWELAEQAITDDLPEPIAIPAEFVVRLAELIVKECMDAVGDGPLERPAIQRIKAKFGVEYYEPIEKAFGVEE
jgi:hypothetical protein